MNQVTLNSDEVFFAALEMEDGNARSAYLDKVCGDDADLRRRIEGLLAVNPLVSKFLESPASTPTIAYEPTWSGDGPGTTIGPYKLMEQIGEGGMGVVYVAEQHEPVRRRVALKVIKLGMDTKQVIARFEAERQALAMMEHPNIAKVFDGGTTQSGRPYFVMELVRGLPITEYCDREQLSIRQRLELFVLVCRAVQHAHQKGVIHRDLKPSNILITLHDGVPVPKVIDFGIAKATGQSLTEKTIYTSFAQLVGTPLYMSPEQAELSGLDIDTRSDIYSLGVLLYELLTGTTPFDSETLKKAAFDEMRRMIREDEPPKPSTRLGTLERSHFGVRELAPAFDPPDDHRDRSVPTAPQSGSKLPHSKLATIATHRKADPRKLAHSLRGELDWIAMKALEKDRRRRYETANDFAGDVMRYLTDQPVEACPPSTWYRFRKFARRNKAALTTAGLVAVLLVVVAVVSLVGSVLIWRERNRTEAAYRAEAKQRLRARHAVDDMYTEVAEKWLADEPHMTEMQREFLQKALQYYEEFAQEDSAEPAVALEVGKARRRVGDIQYKLGQYARAREAYSQAITILEKLTAVAPAVTAHRQELARSQHSLGSVLKDTGRPEQAEVVYRRSLAHRNKLATDFPTEPEYRSNLAASYGMLGTLLRHTGRLQQAMEAHERAFDLLKEAVAERPESPEYRLALAQTQINGGALLEDLGRRKEEEETYGAALVILKKLTDDFPTKPEYRGRLADCYNNLGADLWKAGRPVDAEKAYDKALNLQKKLVADYPTIPDYSMALAAFLSNFGALLSETGRGLDAEQAFQQALAIHEKLHSEKSANLVFRDVLADSHNNLAVLLLQTGHLPEAEKAVRQALALRAQLAADAPLVPAYQAELAKSHSNLGLVLQNLRREAEAERAYRDALVIQEKLAVDQASVPQYRADLGRIQDKLGTLLRDSGRLQEAEEAHRQGLVLHQKLVADFPDTPKYQSELGATLHNLAILLDRRGDRDQAHALYEQAVARQQIALKADPPNPTYRQYLRNHYLMLAELMARLGDAPEAERGFRQAVEVAKKLVADYPNVPENRQLLGSLYQNLATLLRRDPNRLPQAEDSYQRAREVWEQLVAEQPASAAYRDNLAETLNHLGVLLWSTGRHRDAEDRYRRALVLREGLTAEFPKNPDQQSKLGGVLSNLAMELRDRGELAEASLLLERAITCQRAALKDSPQNPTYRQFLAKHYSALGKTLIRQQKHGAPADLAAQLKSMKLREGGDSFDWFVLAIVHFQLGNKEEASKWYDQAVTWMEKNAPQDEELRHFRVEAAELLQLAKSPKKGDVPTKEEKK